MDESEFEDDEPEEGAVAARFRGHLHFLFHPPPVRTKWPVRLDPVSLLRQFHFQWASNPIAARLWKKLRVPAFLLGVLFGGSKLLLEAFGVSFIAPDIATGWTRIASWAVLLLLIALKAGVLIAFPVYYARWAYHRTFLNDINLRSAPFDFLERLYGILAPGVAAFVVFFVVQYILSTAALPFSYMRYQSLFPRIGGIHVVVEFLINAALFFIIYISLFVSLCMRRLNQTTEIGRKCGLGFWYLATPLLYFAGTTIAYLIARYFLAYGPFHMSSPKYAIMIVRTLVAGLYAGAFWWQMHKLWEEDQEMARSVLFLAGEDRKSVV